MVVDGNLYVRARSGTGTRWYRSAMAQHAGRIRAAGKTVEVRIESTGANFADAVDGAYRTKYAGSSYLPPSLALRPSASCLRELAETAQRAGSSGSGGPLPHPYPGSERRGDPRGRRIC